MRPGKCRMEFRLSKMDDGPSKEFTPDSDHLSPVFSVWIGEDSRWVVEADGVRGCGDCRVNAVCDWIVRKAGMHPDDAVKDDAK